MNNQYNVWNQFSKLNTVVLGNMYNVEFYKDIKNNNIRNALMKITEESLEDLENFSNVLKDFGCKVLRPYVNPNDNIMNYLQSGAVQGVVPRSPLQPRDSQFVYGNKIFYTMTEEPIENLLDKYNSKDKVDLRFQDMRLDWSRLNNAISAASYTAVGRDLYIDIKNRSLEDWQIDLIKSNVKDVRFNYINHGGHSDGCFHIIKEGVILSIEEIQTYSNTFPKWDVCYLSDSTKHSIQGFMKMKRKVRGKWWVPGEEDNHEFTNFVETWLQDWVGYVEETIFDVNCLVLDEHYVAVSTLNPTVTEFLKKHKMEPVHVPWKHRWFWDGGLHCITLELNREGTQQDYFPSRHNKGVIDYGYE